MIETIVFILGIMCIMLTVLLVILIVELVREFRNKAQTPVYATPTDAPDVAVVYSGEQHILSVRTAENNLYIDINADCMNNTKSEDDIDTEENERN